MTLEERRTGKSLSRRRRVGKGTHWEFVGRADFGLVLAEAELGEQEAVPRALNASLRR